MLLSPIMSPTQKPIHPPTHQPTNPPTHQLQLFAFFLCKCHSVTDFTRFTSLIRVTCSADLIFVLSHIVLTVSKNLGASHASFVKIAFNSLFSFR